MKRSENNVNITTEHIFRISYYEELYEKIKKTLAELETAISEFEALKPDIARLASYYESGCWKKDFEDDEAHILPQNLKRGVLSEDGIYLLLDAVKETDKMLKRDNDND